MAGQIGEARVVINFNTHEGIELTKLSTSFKALANLYKDFVFNKIEQKNQKPKGVKAKLHITSIKNNCVELHLGILATDCVAATLSDPQLAMEFVKYALDAIKRFKEVGLQGITSLSGFPYKESEIKNIEEVLKAISKNIDAGFGMKAIEYDGATKSLKAEFFNHKDVELTLKGIREIKKELANVPKDPSESLLLRLVADHIGNSRGRSQTGFRGIIKTKSNDAFPVYMTGKIKAQIANSMNNAKGNPLKLEYPVGVIVKKNKEGKIESYEITEWNKIVPPTDSPK